MSGPSQSLVSRVEDLQFQILLFWKGASAPNRMEENQLPILLFFEEALAPYSQSLSSQYFFSGRELKLLT